MSGVGSEDLVGNMLRYKKRRAVLYVKAQGTPTQADLTITFSKAEGFETITENLVAFIYVNNETVEIDTRKTIVLVIT